MPLRTIVSQNRRRYQNDGFNLDLTYITDRIIAMGYPADTAESLYRNSIGHIVHFLEHYHPNNYKVFNLRGQYVYDTSRFHNRVISFEMTDHHPPRLELMAPFCREVHEFLQEDSRNIVAVHCKAGKGRTGVMICAYLCYINFYWSPRQNMDYYSVVRTHNNKGVTIPSQRRYVYYFHHLRQKQLNYVPLKVELVGIYVEKPPKLSGPFSKGALKLRVANGDVEVFEGKELWISSEMHEEEEQMHRKYPVMAGQDQHDPYALRSGNECISRRCYGWTVPREKRIFVEGDIRVDLYHKSQIKILNVPQEKKKIGHIWFNTMFTCPGFSGGQYIHGDELYPLDGESMIVRRRLRRKGTTDMSSSTDDLPDSWSAKTSTASSNPQNESSNTADKTAALQSASLPPEIFGTSPTDRKPISPLARQENSSKEAIPPTTPSHLEQPPNSAPLSSKKHNRLPLKLQMRKRSDRSPNQESAKEWNSMDAGGSSSHHSSRFSIAGGFSKKGRNSTRIGIGHNSDDFVEEFEVETPPGLEAHCPPATLAALYGTDKRPPRHDIEEILKDAGRRNLIADSYNMRRLSVPKEGNPMPKSPLGRPDANGPWCLMRQKGEHVQSYSTLEIDRAHKKKELDLGFRVIIVTRCIDEGNAFDMQLAQQFIKVTRKKQTDKDKAKKEKMMRHRQKFDVNPDLNMVDGRTAMSTQTEISNPDEEPPLEPSGITGCTSTGTYYTADGEHIIPECDNPLADARKHDPHLTKYYFRQRVSSKSRHPLVHYHCPLLDANPSVCSKYGCKYAEELKSAKSAPERLDCDPRLMEAKQMKSCPLARERCSDTSDMSEEEFPMEMKKPNARISTSHPSILLPSSHHHHHHHEDEFEEGERTGSAVSSWNTSSASSQFTNDAEGDSASDLSAELQQRSDTMTVPPYAQTQYGNRVVVIGAPGEANGFGGQRVMAGTQTDSVNEASVAASPSDREMMVKAARGEFHPSDRSQGSASSISSVSSQSYIDEL